MNKPTLIVACAAAFIGMGVSMPSCPDKAMQQQVAKVSQDQQLMTAKLMKIDAQNKTLDDEFGQTKQLLGQLASAVMAQKDAIDRMDVALKDAQTKIAELEKSRPAHPKSRTTKRKRR